MSPPEQHEYLPGGGESRGGSIRVRQIIVQTLVIAGAVAVVSAVLIAVVYHFLTARPPGTISYAHYQDVQIGEPRKQVERELGSPDDSMDVSALPAWPAGLTCTYYEDSSPAIMDPTYYRFCFDGNGRLAQKNSHN
jgi:hypothetical protein